MEITYIPMARGLVYLAVVLDWFSRRVLSWGVSIAMEAAFCVETLEDAVARHKSPRVRGFADFYQRFSVRQAGNVGFRSLYVGDPVSGNGMAAMTNGDKGEEVCNALRQRVATAYGWR